MKALAKVCAFLFVCFSSGSLLAENNIHYNYGEFRYVFDSEVDDTNIDGDGIGFGGSIRLDELFYAVADYEAIDYDFNIDTMVIQAGLGIIFPVNKIDAVAELALVHGDADSGIDNADDTGYRLSGGLRGYALPNLELRAMLNRIDLDEDDTFLTVGGDYFINSHFSVNFAKDLSADIERFSIGLRYYLGQ